ncbi:hypothetical protein LUZ60_016087 [Juncus effusus]|nr:hypothetical protein LUZ60_016087 [Juncus effusus]
METLLISNLRKGLVERKIVVRAFRVWEATNPSKNNELISMECALVDVEGDTIQATIRKFDVPRFKSIIRENELYSLSRFIVVEATKKYRAVPNKKMIEIQKSTIVECLRSCEFEIPLHVFNFQKFSMIKDQLPNDELLIDVIGYIVGIGPMEEVNLKNRIGHKRNMELQDSENEKITLTLWEEYGYGINMDDIIDKSRTEFVVAIFCGMTVRKYKEKSYVCTTSATKCYIDEDFPEVTKFKSSLKELPQCVVELASKEVPVMTLAQQKSANRCTIDELLSLDPNEHQGQRFTCNAKVVNIDNIKGWWYTACKTCGMGMKKYDSKLWCTNCWNSNKSVAMYKINFIVQDDTNMANFIMFSNVADEFIGISARDLISYLEPETEEIPALLTECIGREEIFQVGFDRRAVGGLRRSFVVSKIFPSVATFPKISTSESGQSSKQLSYLDFESQTSEEVNTRDETELKEESYINVDINRHFLSKIIFN